MMYNHAYYLFTTPQLKPQAQPVPEDSAIDSDDDWNFNVAEAPGDSVEDAISDTEKVEDTSMDLQQTQTSDLNEDTQSVVLLYFHSLLTYILVFGFEFATRDTTGSE